MKEKGRVDFTREESGRGALMAWWTGLNDDRGARAELRRCRTPAEIRRSRSFYELFFAVSKTTHVNRERLALVAGVTAEVRVHEARPFGRALSGRTADEAMLKEGRFRRLLRIEDHGELFRDARRAVRLTDQTANVAELAHTLYWWDQDWIRARLAEDYYQTQM